MNTYEFQYYLRDTDGSIDEGFLLTEVVTGVNKIMAEEAFLDILKDKNVNPSNVYIISAEKVPEVEESIEISDIEEEIEIEDYFEYNANVEDTFEEPNEEVDYDL